MQNLMLASDYAKQHNTTTDVVISLIQDNRLPAKKGKDNKWYINPLTPVPASPYERRLIHCKNQVKQVFTANKIKTKLAIEGIRIKRYSTTFDEYTKATKDNQSINICFNVPKRSVYLSKLADREDYNITAMLKDEGIKITQNSVYERMILLINQRLYNSFLVVVPKIDRFATKDTLNEAIEVATKLSTENNQVAKIYYKGNKVQSIKSQQ